MLIKVAEMNGTEIYAEGNILDKVGAEIIAEKASTPGLKEFSDQKYNEYLEFIDRLTLVKVDNYKDAAKIVEEVLNCINNSEADTTLKGNFRETNLDWQYTKKVYARDYFSWLASKCTKEEAKRYLSTSVRKLSK